jgi:glucoamylase
VQERTRRAAALLVGATVLVSATVIGEGSTRSFASQHELGLHSAGVALSGTGEVTVVRPDRIPAFHPGTRVAVAAGKRAGKARTAANRQRAWLAEGDVPGKSTMFADLSRTSLLDLDTLLLPNGALLAGGSTSWRYVWPRDASFAAAALARSGHPADGLDILLFLQSTQEADGSFQARYRPSGAGAVPDSRGIQQDGAGWALWGIRQWLDASSEPAAARAGLRALRPLVRRSAAGLIELLDPDTHLPPASSDYWERDESDLTLGAAAPILAGLRAAPALLTALGDGRLARQSRLAGQRLDASIHTYFGPRGYPRVITGNDRDAAIAFLMPPFAESARADVHQAWLTASQEMRQPAGGLSPGVGWKDDGISWTPETALFALSAAASGETDLALGWISWLDTHRTALGSLPEKVTARGNPASVAPLAWTAALVVLTLDELEDNGRLPPLPRERLPRAAG